MHRRKPYQKPCGFTLIELITAMTITAMIVMMLYWAFAMGSRVWDSQDLKTATLQREEAFFRLLDQDMRELVPYTMRWERGTLDFFAGGATALFYVTRGGLGAQSRSGKALFFTCLFVRPNPEEGQDLVLYKTSVPEEAILEELHSFQMDGEFARQDWQPTPAIMDEAVIFLEKLGDVAFHYVREPLHPFQGMMVQGAVADKPDDESEYLEEWVSRELPGVVLVTYELEDRQTEIVVVPGQGAL